MQLRRMNEADILSAVTVFVDAFSNPPWEYTWMTAKKAGRYIRDLYHLPGSLCFVYEESDLLAGICLGSINDYFLAAQYELKELAIPCACQRKGVGSRMLAALEAYLSKECGVSFITLQTALNSVAYSFYEKNGYTGMKENVFFMKNIM